jgi:hypothetical protein
MRVKRNQEGGGEDLSENCIYYGINNGNFKIYGSIFERQ